MPRVNRREILAEQQIQVFHVVNRCVRRTFLCGKDAVSKKDYSHRREWIRRRLEFLAGVFTVDILSFAVMSNHLHVVIRTRPDITASLSDEDVARRWWELFPARKNKDKSAAEPSMEELNEMLNSPNGIREKRRRLANLSWFMKCLCEPIAKQANHEDEVRGHFWEARFKAQPLLDEMAITACMSYVDLNPVRARMANSLETSDFTSVQARIQDRVVDRIDSTPDGQVMPIEQGRHAGWLAPIELDTKSQTIESSKTHRRASHRGCLRMSLDQYLQLLDWTGRQFRNDKAGVISNNLEPILERLQCSVESWMDLIRNFRRRFRTEAGRKNAIADARSLRKKRLTTNQQS